MEKPVYVPVALSLDEAGALLAAASVVVRSAPLVGLDRDSDEFKNLASGMLTLAEKTDEAKRKAGLLT